MRKETKMNLNELGKSLLFITPLVGDIPTHRFFSKRRAKNLEQRMELEKIKTEFKESKNLGVYFPRTQESIEYQEKPIEYLEFMLSKKLETAIFTAKYFVWTPMIYYFSKALF